MFKTGDIVIYGMQGICRIKGIEEKDFKGTKNEYLVLKPLKNEHSTYFVPINNECAMSKIRKPLSEIEINSLIDSMPKEQANWVSNKNKRKEEYKNIISNGNHTEIIKMIKAIFSEKKERESTGKKLQISDERFLNEAEELLYSEFQYVLNLNEEKLMTYITERIEKRQKQNN